MKKIIVFILVIMLFPILTKANITVDGQSYSTVNEANLAIKDNSEVVFNSDYYSDSTDTSNTEILQIVKNGVDVNLQGHKINYINVNDTATNVKIRNGILSSNIGCVLFVGHGASATINNVFIKTTSCSSCNNDNNAFINQGELTIRDAQFDFDNTAKNESNAILSIKESKFVKNPSAISNSGTLKIDEVTQSSGTVNLYSVSSNYTWETDAKIVIDGIPCVNTFAANLLIKEGSIITFFGNYQNTSNNPKLYNYLSITKNDVTVDLNGKIVDLVMVTTNNTGVTIKNGTISNKYGLAFLAYEGTSVQLNNVNILSKSCGSTATICDQADSSHYNNAIYNKGNVTINGGKLKFDNTIYNAPAARLTFTNATVTKRPSTINNSGTVTVNGSAKTGNSIELFSYIPTYNLGDWDNNKSITIQDVVVCREYIANIPAIKTTYPYLEQDGTDSFDLNADGKIDLVDLVKLRIMAATSS